MSKHTLGPWMAMDTGNILDRHGNRIARYQDSHFLPEREMDANGRLIAAAPEMLEALKGALEYFDDKADAEYLPGKAAPVGNSEMQLAGEIRAAIAKATGGKS